MRIRKTEHTKRTRNMTIDPVVLKKGEQLARSKNLSFSGLVETLIDTACSDGTAKRKDRELTAK